ncbi:hypothetical protein F8M41_022035 [Gigaspora margarita]|uniref:Uncharacterized protein n=1 Tax=Gigaspora margarita TaxID=4874 RepID=A0A8H4AFU2_GIGMA|nr:hypothetical protein F8M41_022035 [Gigaspora margarita]
MPSSLAPLLLGEFEIPSSLVSSLWSHELSFHWRHHCRSHEISFHWHWGMLVNAFVAGAVVAFQIVDNFFTYIVGVWSCVLGVLKYLLLWYHHYWCREYLCRWCHRNWWCFVGLIASS